MAMWMGPEKTPWQLCQRPEVFLGDSGGQESSVWLWSGSHLWIIKFPAVLSTFSLLQTGSREGEGTLGHRHSGRLWDQMVKERDILS